MPGLRRWSVYITKPYMINVSVGKSEWRLTPMRAASLAPAANDCSPPMLSSDFGVELR